MSDFLALEIYPQTDLVDQLADDLPLNIDTGYRTACQIVLNPGLYDLHGQIAIAQQGSVFPPIYVRLFDGTTTLSVARAPMNGSGQSGQGMVDLEARATVAIGDQTTIYLQGRSDDITDNDIIMAGPSAGMEFPATQLIATQIG